MMERTIQDISILPKYKILELKRYERKWRREVEGIKSSLARDLAKSDAKWKRAHLAEVKRLKRILAGSKNPRKA
jgi:hypothetical protein